MIFKLFKQNVNLSQIIGFTLTSIIGLSILMLNFTLFKDLSPLFDQKSIFGKDIIVLSKKVNMLSSLQGKRTYFLDEELKDIKAQEFVNDLALFKSATFRVQASFMITANQGFLSDIFLESIPPKFIDIQSDDWKFSEGDKIIPVIVPRSYLTLYNFGFAQSQGLPQISENILKTLSFTFKLEGRGRQDRYKGKIVGFSEKINSILVPEEFMTYANNIYGQSEIKPSRLVIETDNVSNPEIAKYFKTKNYDINEDSLKGGKATYFIKLSFAIISSIGFVITGLGVLLLLLSFTVFLYKSKEKLKDLLMIGYSFQQLFRPFLFAIIVINLLSVAISLVVTLFIRKSILLVFNKALSIEASANSILWINVPVLFVVITLLSYLSLRLTMKKVLRS